MSELLLASSLTREDEDRLVELLGRLNPKHMGQRIFNAMARVKPTIAVEAVCFRRDIAAIPPLTQDRVFMIMRGLGQSNAGQWHCPGWTVRSNQDIISVMNNLSAEEIGQRIIYWQFAGEYDNLNEERGHFLSRVFECQLWQTDFREECWFPVDNLPENTVEHHRRYIIPMAHKKFLERCK